MQISELEDGTRQIDKRKAIVFDKQYKFQIGIGYMPAGQKAVELALIVDEDCADLGIERSPTGVASWNGDRRPPLFWAGSFQSSVEWIRSDV